MSFSSEVKNEIMSQTEMTKRQRIARLIGMLCFGAHISDSQDGYRLKFSTENPKIARAFYQLIKKDCEITARLRVFRGPKNIVYYVTIDNELYINDIFHTVGLLKRNEEISDFKSYFIGNTYISDTPEKKEFIKGAFLASGSIIDPKKNCHLEFVSSHKRLCDDMQKLLSEFGLTVKTALRKSNYVIYFKSTSDVADILTLLGAYNCVMEYHNIKIVKDMRNSINRRMNCDNANMTKTINAAFKQAQAIEKLIRLGKLEELSSQLQEVARLRLENKELGLKELGEMMHPPIGKSGVNHRLRKLCEEADKYK